ncbi:DinB family protein [Mucilaginibacter psychrotolerans]|uniref:DinB family protein n=1 Tax=Mucilaginibacter psychrotolerans TaxID=1524096 RepID=A0A4Y8S877_9SPHI|nr:DinB family protein [Mucilaginibacter psychrotolerans]TFF35209.1 DinB family protein [Mucilaginibacter psychrotolerans]
MNIAKERRAIEAALDSYREQLDSFTGEAFAATPSIGGWSLSEVYDHILKASLSSSIALERCTHNNCPPTKKGMNLWGYYVMLTGRFPFSKVKMPESVAAKMAPRKIEIEEAKNLLIKVRKRVESTAALVPDAPASARWEHPRLGMLNAAQWFRFIRVHLQHHLKQLERIKASM